MAVDPLKEVVDIVNENNAIVQSGVPRADVRKQNLRHRSTYIFVHHRNGNLIVEERTKIKDYCPGFWDACAGGVVSSGESYELNASRELEEELGLKVPLKHCFTFYYEDERLKTFGDVWRCNFDGEMSALQLQESEVSSVRSISIDDIFKSHNDGTMKFTPDSLFALKQYANFTKKETKKQQQQEKMKKQNPINKLKSRL